MTDVKELLPCPFCGNKKISLFSADDLDCGGFIIQCLTGCPAQVWADTEAEAVKAWNTRPSPDRESVAKAIADAAGATWPQDAGRYRAMADAALYVHPSPDNAGLVAAKGKALISALDYREIGDKVAEAGATHWEDIQIAATELDEAIAALSPPIDRNATVTPTKFSNGKVVQASATEKTHP